MILCVIFLFFFAARPVENANVLFVTTMPSLSHQIVFQPIWKELSLRGHKVTVITPNPLKDKTLTNLTEIDISYLYILKAKVPKTTMNYFFEKPGFLQVFLKDIFATAMFSKVHESILGQPGVQGIIHGNHKFDVVIAEWLFPTSAAFAAKFNCPLIGITSLGAPIPALDTVGNPTHPIYSPDHNLPIGRELCFRDRILSSLYSIYVRVYYHLVVLPREDRSVKKFFGEDMPYLGDIERNVSLLLLNRNPVLHKIMPLVPAVIEIGGVRSNKINKPLNPELKKFVDNSKNSVIYFSLGSNILSTDLPDDLRDAIIETFGQLPYDFVWKWENDVLPGKPKNVFIQKWVPQGSLLAHPKVKLFIMQGGLQSMEETVNNHVPIIGIPAQSDQTLNVDTAVKYGFGIQINLEDISVHTLKAAINEIMNNYPSYKENIAKVEKLMNDRPTEGLDKAIWWIEYAIRRRGAKHLRSPSLDIPWHQYLLLDVIAVVVLALFLLTYVPYKIRKIIILLFKKLFNKGVKSKKE